MVSFARVLRIHHGIIYYYIALPLLLLPLPFQHAAPCPAVVEELIVVATTSDAEALAEYLTCDGPGMFAVSWNGAVTLSRTLLVTNGTTLNVTGSSESTGDGTNGDDGAVIDGDGTLLLLDIDLGSKVWLTGLTLSGGAGALRVTGESYVEAIDCSFIHNNRTSSDSGGAYSADSRGLIVTDKWTGSFYNSYGLHDGGARRIQQAQEKSNLTEYELGQRGSSSDDSIERQDAATIVSGGAVYVGGNSTVFFGGKTVFINNTATNGGGAIYADAGSIVAFFRGETVFTNNRADFGGAIYLRDSSKLNVAEGGSVFFRSNYGGSAGGAIHLYNSSIFNIYGAASFVSNEANDSGGAFALQDGSKVNFMGDVDLEGNIAVNAGGAIYAEGSYLVFGGQMAFANNTAKDNNGGAIYLRGSSQVNVTEGGSVSFHNNYAGYAGGAIGIYSQSILDNYGIASFVSNEAEFGGALAFEDESEVHFFGNALFEGNHAAVSGGAVYAEDSSAILGGDTVFTKNTAKDNGGALYWRDSSELNVTERGSVSFKNNYAGNAGGALRTYNQSVFNCFGTASFVSNEAKLGGAIGLASGSKVNLIDIDTVFYGVDVANSTGGGGSSAVSSTSGAMRLEGRLRFESNSATNGGAVSLDDASIIQIDGMTSFLRNVAASNGGAIYASDSSVLVGAGTLFTSNVASTGSGGGVYASSSVMILNKAEFTGNHGAWGGGVASFSSGFIIDEETGSIAPSNITGCSFEGNTATDGGAVYTASGYDRIVDSSFTRNFAAVQGGALLHSGVLVALRGSTFESNMAGEDGLAVMSLGMAEVMSNVSFRNNSFVCSSGKYALEEDSDKVEDSDTCRWSVVCSRCTDQCDVPRDIEMDEATVPLCEVVPEGVNTSGNSGMTLKTLNLMPGFYRTSAHSREILECYRKEACIGGSIAGHYCAEGFTGPYCAACDEGYGSGFQYSCHSCRGPDSRAAIGGAVAVLAVAVLVVALGVTYLVGVVDRPIFDETGRWRRRILSFRDGLVRAIPLTAIKIVLVSWQIITQFSGVVNVQYPPTYEAFLAALSVINFDLGSILSLACVVETNFYVRLVLATIAPVVVLGILAITYQIAMVRNGHSIHARRVARNKHISVGLFLLFVVYSSVSYTIFQTFVCDTLDSGATYLHADYDLVCWTRLHVAYMAYAGFMILVYPVGIPAVFASALFTNRDGIKSLEGITARSWVPPEPEAIKDLWAPYKRSRYYYEVIECGRRIALTGLAVFIFPGSTAQVAIEALLAVVFFSVSEILSPFVEPLDAWLYRSGTWVIFLSMYLALLLKVDAADEDSHSQGVFGGLLITAHGCMVLVVIVNALLSALKGFREVRAVEEPCLHFRPAPTRDTILEFKRRKTTTPDSRSAEV